MNGRGNAMRHGLGESKAAFLQKWKENISSNLCFIGSGHCLLLCEMMKIVERMVPLFFMVLCFCITCSKSQLSSHVSSSEIIDVKSSATATLNKPPSLVEAFFATKVLDPTKSTGFTCNCALLGSLFKGASSNLEIYYGVATSKACGCGLEASAEAKLAVFEGLKSDLLVEVAGAAMLWYE